MNMTRLRREYYKTYIYAWRTQQFVVGGRPQHMKGLQRTYLHLGAALICSVQRPQHLKSPSSRQIYHILNSICQNISNVFQRGPEIGLLLITRWK